MKIFLSHARKDSHLARDLAVCLEEAGFSVWIPEDHIMPGDNWAKKMAKALDDSDLMVLLITPRSFESDVLRQNIEFAIGSQKFAHRLFSVLAGPKMNAGKDVPWILLKLPHRHVRSAKEFSKVADDIEQMSHVHA